MRKGQDRKVKIAGRAGCLGLLAIGMALVNPVGLSVYAEEIEDYGIDAQSMTASTVMIAFLPTSASGSVTPVDTMNGDKAKVDVQASVRVQNSGGYAVYVGSESSELVNGTNVIKSVETPSTYADLPINRWGYSFQEGTTAKDSYVAMPATLRSNALYSNTDTNIVDEIRTFMLSFAARIGADMPAGTYTNSVTMSIVSSPRDVASLMELVNMQDMTSSICASSKVGDSKQLKDVRDGKYYWVSKLADNKCWMTQNLDLDLVEGAKLTADTSDVSEGGYIPNYTTATIVDENTILADNAGQRSWNLGNYRIANPDTLNSCGIGKNNAADCPAQFTEFETPMTQDNKELAHYILGNHYQWNAATAGTGGTITSGQATNSICPRGWKLPTGGSGSELDGLVTALGGTSTTNNITKAPFYGVRSGSVFQGSGLFGNAGDAGDYWSSTPDSGAVNAYRSFFSGTTHVVPSINDRDRQRGCTVRCIAR